MSDECEDCSPEFLECWTDQSKCRKRAEQGSGGEGKEPMSVTDSMTSKKCLNPTCGSDAYARGLCQGCYNSARRLVVMNQTTWDHLKANGKCLSARARKGKRMNWFLS